MDAEDQHILTKGFTDLNKKRAHMHQDAVVEFLLLYSPVKELEKHSDGWTVQRMASLRGLVAEGRLGSPRKRDNDLVDWKDAEGQAISAALADMEPHFNSPSHMAMAESEPMMPTSDELNLLNSSSEVFKVSQEQISEKKISTQRFRAIMRQASKAYDVDKVVKELDDGTGFIDLGGIPEFGSPIRTLCDDVLSDSENIGLEI